MKDSFLNIHSKATKLKTIFTTLVQKIRNNNPPFILIFFWARHRARQWWYHYI